MPGVAAELQAAAVEIGGRPIRLLSDSSAFLQMVQERYSAFVTSADSKTIDVIVDLVSAGPITEQEDVCLERKSIKWIAERADFRLEWDLQSKQCVLRQSINPYSLDTAIRILHTLFLAEEGGFLLHASSVVRNGKAFLFFGPSGAGKTTVARSAPVDATLLTDEISYVRRVDHTYVAYGTPFAGELAKIGENVSAPIAGLYHLEKAKHNRLTPLQPAEAVRLLLQCILFFASDRKLVNQVFHSACEIVSRLPVYRLEFLPDRRLWDLLA